MGMPSARIADTAAHASGTAHSRTGGEIMASTRVLWASLAGGAATMTAILTGAHAVAPYLASDAPPLAGIARVDNAIEKITQMFNERSNATQSIVVKGQILGAWSRLCDAQRAKNLALAES